MTHHVVFLSVPGLRAEDLARMPHLTALGAQGSQSRLIPSFPCVTWPVQANLLTGKLPREHGVIANGFYWRDTREVEMWTAWNDKITAPQIWDQLHTAKDPQKSAVWFPMLSKGSGADYVCMPAPVHNPDGSESLWCYTKPGDYYGELRDTFGHFPLQHFWGPMANIKSSAWIVATAIHSMRRFQPSFFYIYLPHLDYAAQRTGPDSPPAIAALGELDNEIGKLVAAVHESFAPADVTWMVASEYVISPVEHVAYPNRLLREAGLLEVRAESDGEHLDLENSQAWALVDHQFSHVFVRDPNSASVARVADVFRGHEGIAEIVAGDDRARWGMDHPRSGEIILISTPNSWQAYYWWLDDHRAPAFARTVDIHRKPGYDPVELHFDFSTKTIPLDATLVRGSHGAPAHDASQQGVLLCSQPGVVPGNTLRDIDVAELVLKRLGHGN